MRRSYSSTLDLSYRHLPVLEQTLSDLLVPTDLDASSLLKQEHVSGAKSLTHSPALPALAGMSFVHKRHAETRLLAPHWHSGGAACGEGVGRRSSLWDKYLSLNEGIVDNSVWIGCLSEEFDALMNKYKRKPNEKRLVEGGFYVGSPHKMVESMILSEYYVQIAETTGEHATDIGKAIAGMMKKSTEPLYLVMDVHRHNGGFGHDPSSEPYEPPSEADILSFLDVVYGGVNRIGKYTSFVQTGFNRYAIMVVDYKLSKAFYETHGLKGRLGKTSFEIAIAEIFRTKKHDEENVRARDKAYLEALIEGLQNSGIALYWHWQSNQSPHMYDLVNYYSIQRHYEI